MYGWLRSYLKKIKSLAPKVSFFIVCCVRPLNKCKHSSQPQWHNNRQIIWWDVWLTDYRKRKTEFFSFCDFARTLVYQGLPRVRMHKSNNSKQGLAESAPTQPQPPSPSPAPQQPCLPPAPSSSTSTTTTRVPQFLFFFINKELLMKYLVRIIFSLLFQKLACGGYGMRMPAGQGTCKANHKPQPQNRISKSVHCGKTFSFYPSLASSSWMHFFPQGWENWNKKESI